MSANFYITYSKPLYWDIYNRLLHGDKTKGQTGVPDGGFYLKKGEIVPFSYYPTNFLIHTDNPGEAVSVQVYQQGAKNSAARNIKTVTTVLNNRANIVPLQMGRGENYIAVTELTSGRKATLGVSATYYATVLMGYAREIFNHIRRKIDRQSDALFSKYATRMPEMLIPFQNMLPGLPALQTFSLRMITRSFLNRTSADLGVQELITTLVQNTPYMEKLKASEDFDPVSFPLIHSQEHFSGHDAHVWIPNLAITQWIAFTKFVDNIQPYSVDHINEFQVAISVSENEQQLHNFDFDEPKASLFNLSFSPLPFSIIIELLIDMDIWINAASYRLDNFVTELGALGDERVVFDLGIPLDGGLPFDIDEVDPGGDGWVGLSLDGRMEQNPAQPYAWDSWGIQPAEIYGGKKWVYDKGFYTQEILNTLQESEAVETYALSAGGDILSVPSQYPMVLTAGVWETPTAPQADNLCLVAVDGLVYQSGIDYTRSGKQFTFTPALTGGQQPMAQYYTLPQTGIIQEAPAGAVNGVNTVYTLSAAPYRLQALFLTLDGIPMTRGVDYTLTGATVTFLIPPVTGQVLWAYYYSVDLSIPPFFNLDFKQEVLTGVVDGINTDFLLSRRPVGPEIVLVAANTLMTKGPDWELISNYTVRFATPPAVGQTPEAWYMWRL